MQTWFMPEAVSFFSLASAHIYIMICLFCTRFPSKCSVGSLPLFISLLQIYATACFGLIGLLQTYKLLLEGESFQGNCCCGGFFFMLVLCFNPARLQFYGFVGRIVTACVNFDFARFLHQIHIDGHFVCEQIPNRNRRCTQTAKVNQKATYIQCNTILQYSNHIVNECIKCRYKNHSILFSFSTIFILDRSQHKVDKNYYTLKSY